MTFWKIPTEVCRWDHPGLEFWRQHYGWLNKIDPSKVGICLDSAFNYNQIADHFRVVVCSSFEIDPRLNELITLSKRYPEKLFVWLCDSDLYDCVLPSNIVHIRYRHLHLKIKSFKENYHRPITPIKNKKITHKFSSLSFWPRQSRAFVTALLSTYAKSQSIISWHGFQDHQIDIDYANSNGITRSVDYKFFSDLIDSLKTSPQFSELNWDILDSILKIDDYELHQNFVEYNISDIDNPAYQNCWSNFNNETNSFGDYYDGVRIRNNPGPYLTEKTIKCLVSGCVLLNSGQPKIYSFLDQQYGIQCRYSFSMDYDNIFADFDRLHALMTLVKDLSDESLSTLIDRNIDACADIQNTILSDEWQELVKSTNCLLDQEVLRAIETVL